MAVVDQVIPAVGVSSIARLFVVNELQAHGRSSDEGYAKAVTPTCPLLQSWQAPFA